jgi:two-component system, NarL family, invasion response regulator UvrY
MVGDGGVTRPHPRRVIPDHPIGMTTHALATASLSAGMMVGVLLVDDHPQFREAARDLVEATPGFESLGEAGSGEEALKLVDELDPALVLLDVGLPGMDGIETARNITSVEPHPTVFLVSMDDLADQPASIESCGAATFVRKRDLCSAALRDLWAEHGRGGNSATP